MSLANGGVEASPVVDRVDDVDEVVTPTHVQEWPADEADDHLAELYDEAEHVEVPVLLVELQLVGVLEVVDQHLLHAVLEQQLAGHA